VYDEILGTNRTTPHTCKGKCKGLAYCGVTRYHPAEKKALQKRDHKNLHNESIKKLKDSEHTFSGISDNPKNAPTEGQKFTHMVTSMRDKLQEKSSDTFAGIVDISKQVPSGGLISSEC